MTTNYSTYYLIFSDSNRWFKHLLKIGFSHITIFKELKNEQVGETLFIELQPANHLIIDSTISIQKINKHIKFNTTHKIVKVVVDNKRIPTSKRAYISLNWGIFSCVWIAKYILGFRGFIFTPQQLYKSLLKKRYCDINKHIHSVEII